jgi:hypothetical protein
METPSSAYTRTLHQEPPLDFAASLTLPPPDHYMVSVDNPLREAQAEQSVRDIYDAILSRFLFWGLFLSFCITLPSALMDSSFDSMTHPSGTILDNFLEDVDSILYNSMFFLFYMSPRHLQLAAGITILDSATMGAHPPYISIRAQAGFGGRNIVK